MLTHLKFRNWRSLRDVEINDLAPLTVFIGANSSGKTNIIEALRFRQYGAMKENRGFLGALRQWGGAQKIITLGTDENWFSIELTYKPLGTHPSITSRVAVTFPTRPDEKIHYNNFIMEGALHKHEEVSDLPPDSRIEKLWPDVPKTEHQKRVKIIQQYTQDYITKRWQILKEGFSPRLSLSSDENIGDLYLLESNGRNLPTVISEMQMSTPEIYTQLQEDLAWLLNHINKFDLREDDQETRIAIRERVRDGVDAPSISAGTGRILAMLAAYYALDMDQERFETPYGRMFEFDISRVVMPGLIVIEEPDAALNPGILRNFVEQLRNYTSRPDARQFILTTHNPSFLNYFKPEEVRVVSRGDDGYTRVDQVPEHISELWLKDGEYKLGEVWTTNSFGGITR